MEHIVLQSKVVPDEFSQEETKVHARIVQKISYKDQVTAFTLFNSHFLRVERLKPKSRRSDISFDLGCIDPCPKKVINISWFWLLASIIGLGFSYLLFYFGFHLAYQATLACLIVVCFLCFVHFSGASYKYLSLNGHVVVFELYPKLPNEKVCTLFMKLLTQRITFANNQAERDKKSHLGREIKLHRELFEAKLINQATYEKAKARILGQYD